MQQKDFIACSPFPFLCIGRFWEHPIFALPDKISACNYTSSQLIIDKKDNLYGAIINWMFCLVRLQNEMYPLYLIKTVTTITIRI